MDQNDGDCAKPGQNPPSTHHFMHKNVSGVQINVAPSRFGQFCRDSLYDDKAGFGGYEHVHR